MPKRRYNLELTADELHVLKAIGKALKFGDNVSIAAQRAQEECHDVQPVATDSEEYHAIQESINEIFNKLHHLDAIK